MTTAYPSPHAFQAMQPITRQIRSSIMSIKIESEIAVQVGTAVTIAGSWLVGWSGILLLLAFV
jgi:hypothetical protein